ncbi:efflux RND transporter periplasmic adaptor subunit, partial [Amphritea sp.]|uniref:efflux RND transporter periplasmic adaptor subunit n=1 Tax=Amphritea sp. TaxID=1872502 RepID=UPI003D12BC95
MKFNQFLPPALLSLTLICSSMTQAAGLPAEVIHVQSKSLTQMIEAVGGLSANESIILRPEQSGSVEKVLFTEGSTVKSGETLVVLDASLYKAQLQESKARVNLSRIAYNRAASLVKKKVGSQQDMDS